MLKRTAHNTMYASAFTQANDLAWNQQTLFCCQCAMRLELVYHGLQSVHMEIVLYGDSQSY
jgi:hypothetical protein